MPHVVSRIHEIANRDSLMHTCPVGRHTELDDLISKKICDAAEGGVSRNAAASLVGVTSRTVFNWVEKGRRGLEPYAAFFQKLETAEAKAEKKVVDALMGKALEGNVPAITFWLQQRRPREWGALVQPLANDDHESSVAEGAEGDYLRSALAALESQRKTG